MCRPCTRAVRSQLLEFADEALLISTGRGRMGRNGRQDADGHHHAGRTAPHLGLGLGLACGRRHALGMMLAYAPVVWLGERMTRRIPLRLVPLVSAAIFALLGCG